MTEINETNIDITPSYTIPLDSLDLAYLGKYLQSSSADKTPLWTNQRLDGESEYCQVVIITKANKDEESYSEPSETYKCHICNVDVPSMCQQQHNASDQHDVMKKIYENVLESVTKQINSNKIHDDNDFGNDVYYCEHCSKMVKLKNRRNHQVSDYHVKSVNQFKIIDDFYKILRDRKNNDESEVEKVVLSAVDESRLSVGRETVFCEVNEARFSKDEPVVSEVDERVCSGVDEPVFSEVEEARSSEGVETLFSEVNDRFNELNETVFSEETETAFSEVNQAECDLVAERLNENNEENEASFSSLDSDDDHSLEQPNFRMLQAGGNIETEVETEPSNEQEKHSFEEYVKEMITKYNLKINVPVINGDFIWMVAPNGTVVQVSRNHFHSYKPMMNNIYCQLCNKWISPDTRSHDIYDKHVKKAFRPINDQFTRWVDTISNHCVLCNEVVLKDAKQHINNIVHKNITEKILCQDCNLYIDAHNFPVHINSKKHLTVLMNQNSIEDINSKDLYCKICNKTVHKHALKFHITTKQHIKKKTNDSTMFINNSNGNNNNIKTDNASNNKNTGNTRTHNENPGTSSPAVSVTIYDSEYCDLCKVQVPQGGMRTHVNGKPHKNVVSELHSENRINSPTTGTVATGSSVPNTDSIASTSRASGNLSTSLNSSNASDRVANKLNTYKDVIELIDQVTTHVRCKVCDVRIINSEKCIIEHIKGRNHKENNNKQKMSAYNKLLTATDGVKTQVTCQICNVNIPNVERNIGEHMEGHKHEEAENEVLKFHLITKESSEFVCACCGIQTTDYFDHINSRTHTLQYLQNYEIDKAVLRKYVYEDDIDDHVRHRHRELYKNLLKHNGIYKSDSGFFYCGMCKIKLGRVSEIDHVLGERHTSQMEKMNKISSILQQLQMADFITP